MSDILSQEEVDALLSAVSAGGDASEQGPKGDPAASLFNTDEPRDMEKSLALYDFRRPDRVSKDQMRTLQNLHEATRSIFHKPYQFSQNFCGN